MSTDASPSWQDILDLVAQLDEGGYEFADVEFGDVRVRMSRSAELPPDQRPALPPQVAESAPPTPAAEGTPVPAPMIGVFYRSPSPGAPPFVEPGTTVEPDTTVGIIEVMKLMNPVAAGVAGTLTDFLVKDGEQVEFGQPLAVVTEAGTS
ncbi:acetyl-CoA carboxylase biotin carboxyl carrier protein [Streptomyces sp. NPDC058683]|uniref:acetyl-CoA carboxylase biotin carboxyl carrier protein n=1 Tax=Streptomyces sp. NPDC058683 TaxID=3346597 RepID=UPI0036661B75